MPESELDIRITTDNAYVALTGKLWGVYYEDLGENLPCYNGTTLYCEVIWNPCNMPVTDNIHIYLASFNNKVMRTFSTSRVPTKIAITEQLHHGGVWSSMDKYIWWKYYRTTHESIHRAADLENEYPYCFLENTSKSLSKFHIFHTETWIGNRKFQLISLFSWKLTKIILTQTPNSLLDKEVPYYLAALQSVS